MKSDVARTTTRFFLFISFLFSLVAPAFHVSAQASPTSQAQAMLARLSTEERIGQLFLVTFQGNSTEPGTPIYDLIANHFIGGVILTAANDNFSSTENILPSTYHLISSLQRIGTEQPVVEIEGTTATPTDVPVNPNHIPLFVGVSQEGDQFPYDQILSGLTTLPNQMAIGATWNTDLAEQVGEVLGSELSSLGFNLILGPSLDVLTVISSESGENLGTRTFGGDPYWVASMGQAMIRGLHNGSDGDLVVIAKYFPGRGSSDRPLEEEVATVRSSLEQLKQIELAPFFAVTGNAPDDASTVDGLLLSHIRYQGFQGNIRATTRPVSFDSAALNLLMSQQELSTWRANGGLIVSDDLGSNAVRRFFDPTGLEFDARQIARNAFLAGNDILYMDQIISSGDPDSYTTILNIMAFFIQRYQEDTAFAELVDAAVLRILTTKYSTYPLFDPDHVIPTEEGLAGIGQSGNIVYEIARQAATLISPSEFELNSVLPDPPAVEDRLIFFTDTQTYQQCSVCAVENSLAADSLQSSIVRLYGRAAGGVIFENHLSSYSFLQLFDFLNNPSNQPSLANDLNRADWVVFSTLDSDPTRPESQALQILLNQRPDLTRNRNVIVFAFNAPYYLDATDISNLTVFYGLYSKSGAFIETAARILFQELSPLGSLPVSVAGVGYDLIAATSPDPNQVIELMLDLPELDVVQSTITIEPTQIALYNIGDSIPIRTGVILDHNGQIVPDGTVVRFLVTIGGDIGATQQFESITSQGIARTSYRITNPGLHDIRVTSDPALNSNILQIEVLPGEAGVVIAITPTSILTETPESDATYSTEELDEELQGSDRLGINLLQWLIASILALGGGWGVYTFGRSRVSLRWGIRWGSCTIIGSMLGYLIGTLSNLDLFWPVMTTFTGSFAGWAAGWIWQNYPDFSRKWNDRNKIKTP